MKGDGETGGLGNHVVREDIIPLSVYLLCQMFGQLDIEMTKCKGDVGGF